MDTFHGVNTWPPILILASHMASDYRLRSWYILQRDKTNVIVYAAITVASVSAVQYGGC